MGVGGGGGERMTNDHHLWLILIAKNELDLVI